MIIRPALRSQSDRRLVTLVRDGYEIAFEEIVRRYARPLGRYAATIVGGRSEDVTQDAFSKALLALRRTDSDIELRPWLYRIVRNTALNDLRDRPPVSELTDTVPAAGGPAEAVEQREELVELTNRLQALPDPQRAAIVMRELEGLGHDEIAAALGLSGGAARQAIYRARSALRDGFGILVPLPLVRALLSEDLTSHAEIATGVAGSAGAGVAVKATAATLLVAGTVGAGVVLHKDPDAADSTPTAHAAVVRHAPEAAGDGVGSSGAEDRGRGAFDQTGAARQRGRDDARMLGGGSARGDDGHGRSGDQHSGDAQRESSSRGEHSTDGHSGSDGSHSDSADSGSSRESGSGETLSGSGSDDSGSGSGVSGDDPVSSDTSGTGDVSSGDGGSTEGSGSGSGDPEPATVDGISGDSRDSSGAGGLIEEMSAFN